MAGFSWISGTLALLLIAENCVAAVDQNKLAEIVNTMWEAQLRNKVWKTYNDRKMFSMAASIPQRKKDKEYNDVLVFNDATMKEVKKKFEKYEVYKNGRLVAARPWMKSSPHAHAEYRVLQDFDTLLNNNYDKENDFLLFYVLGSPCTYQCTKEDNGENILDHLDKIRNWRHYAFVFTDIYKRGNVPNDEEQLRKSLERIGRASDLGLQNIFRCKKSGDDMECSSCSVGNKVARYCVSDSNEESNMPIVPVNNANVASAPSSQGGLDNGNGNGMSRRRGKGGRNRGGRGKRGRKRGGRGKGGRKRGGRGKGGRKRGGRGKGRSRGRRG